MEARHAFFCDAATSDSSGKLNALGIFDNINAKTFPATHPELTLVLTLRGHRTEVGEHTLKINLVDADGKDLIPPIEGKFAMRPEALDANLILNIQNLTLPAPGIYSVDIAVDNHFIQSVALTAKVIMG